MSNLNRILVGIRDSKLSRTQTNILLNQLVSVSSEITSESFVIKTIKTKGDIHSEKRLDQIGGKGLFIKEIEDQIGTISPLQSRPALIAMQSSPVENVLPSIYTLQPQAISQKISRA